MKGTAVTQKGKKALTLPCRYEQDAQAAVDGLNNRFYACTSFLFLRFDSIRFTDAFI